MSDRSTRAVELGAADGREAAEAWLSDADEDTRDLMRTAVPLGRWSMLELPEPDLSRVSYMEFGSGLASVNADQTNVRAYCDAFRSAVVETIRAQT